LPTCLSVDSSHSRTVSCLQIVLYCHSMLLGESLYRIRIEPAIPPPDDRQTSTQPLSKYTCHSHRNRVSIQHHSILGPQPTIDPTVKLSLHIKRQQLVPKDSHFPIQTRRVESSIERNISHIYLTNTTVILMSTKFKFSIAFDQTLAFPVQYICRCEDVMLLILRSPKSLSYLPKDLRISRQNYPIYLHLI
jgi:hypothetical protein